MSKLLKVLLGAGVVGGGIYAVTKLSAKADAAEKMQIEFAKIRIKKVTIKDGISFEVYFNAVNPSTEKLSFTTPFVTIYSSDKDGRVLLSNSSNESSVIDVLPKSSKQIMVPLLISPMQALKLPGLLFYMAANYLDSSAPKTKKLIVEYATTSMGLNISDKMEIAI